MGKVDGSPIEAINAHAAFYIPPFIIIIGTVVLSIPPCISETFMIHGCNKMAKVHNFTEEWKKVNNTASFAHWNHWVLARRENLRQIIAKKKKKKVGKHH